MNKIAISLGPIDIRWYSLFVLSGMLIAMSLIYKEAKKHGYNIKFLTNLIFYIILFGILGARLYFVLFNLRDYMQNPLEIIQIWRGGLAIHGGILAGIIVIIVYTKKYKINLFKTLDFFAVGLIIGQAIGRWGNFFNQEVYGSIVTKAKLVSMKIPNFIIEGMYKNGNYYEPLFLYESIWNVIGFIILLLVRKTRYLKTGTLTAIYLIWYSIGRFIIEGMREEEFCLKLGNIKVAQLVSIILFIVGLIILINNKRKNKFDDLYNIKEKDNIRF